MIVRCSGQRDPIEFESKHVLPGNVSLVVLFLFALVCAGCVGIQQAPTITSAQVPNAEAGALYFQIVTAAGGVKPYSWSLVSGSLPPGIALDARTGALSGIPTELGDFSFQVQVTDSFAPRPGTATRAYHVVVAATPLKITTSALPNAQLGAPFQGDATAIGGVPPYHWRIASGTLPAGLSLDANTGRIAGTPTQTGQLDFSIQVSDSASHRTHRAVKALAISVVALALQITNGGLPRGHVGVPFQASVTPSGGVTPYTWAIVGALPSGLSLNASSGAIAGTPMQAGTAAFLIQLADSAGQTAQKPFAIAGPQPLAISTTALPQPVQAQAYSATLQATGGTPPYIWSVASGQLPASLSLTAAGQLTGTPTAAGQSSFTIQVADSALLTASKSFSLTVADASAPPATDQFGGLLALPSPNGATGHFRVEKFGNRWLFVTPEGHGFFLLGVYFVSGDDHTDELGSSYNARFAAKYGSIAIGWAQANRRLKTWGFNTIGPYSYRMTLPSDHEPEWPGGEHPYKMPFILTGNNTGISGRFTGSYKNLYVGTNPSNFPGEQAPNFPDLYDPGFKTFATNLYSSDQNLAFYKSFPWFIGYMTDDTDYLSGFGPGADFPTDLPKYHFHLGFLVLVTAPTQATNPYSTPTRQPYSDTKVYTKYALRDFLATKYGTIAALNAAWNSTYTSFDSDGGWGTGAGLLDEDGRASHTWLGNPPDRYTLAGMTAQMKADLDDFLYQMAKTYFSIVRTAYKSVAPNSLFLGPTSIGGWGVPGRAPILKAAGQYLDVLNIGGTDGSQAQLDFYAKWVGDIPIATWAGIPAN